MKILYQILWKDHSRTHLLFAFLGTLAGFVLLLSGIQFYIDIKSVLSENRDLLDPEYIVINKQVNIGQTLGLSTAGFSEEEIHGTNEESLPQLRLLPTGECEMRLCTEPSLAADRQAGFTIGVREESARCSLSEQSLHDLPLSANLGGHSSSRPVLLLPTPCHSPGPDRTARLPLLRDLSETGMPALSREVHLSTGCLDGCP